jgi:hypothetical protein
MQVKMAMDDVTITLGRKGVVLTISDKASGHVGHLRIGQATAEWRKGNTQPGNGKTIRLVDLIKLIESA